jgi:ERCC4-type nuclease
LAVRSEKYEPVDRPRYAQQPQPAPAAAAEAMLAAVPGISTVRARALLSHFGGVAEVVAAGEEAWREVPGIGPTRAKALAETFAHQGS